MSHVLLNLLYDIRTYHVCAHLSFGYYLMPAYKINAFYGVITNASIDHMNSKFISLGNNALSLCLLLAYTQITDTHLNVASPATKSRIRYEKKTH